MQQAEGPLSVVMKELLTLVDIAALFADPAFYGIGTPRGNGKPVVVLPGLFGSDFYLQPLHRWLRNTGYVPVPSSLRVNAGCLQRLVDQVLDQIARRVNGGDGTFALIGHSRGGLLAWAIASRLQERVSHLIMLGSPVVSLVASAETGYPNAAPAGQIGRTLMSISSLVRHVLDPDCDYPRCGCSFIDDVLRPLSSRIAVLSIYGRNDLVVAKAAQATDGEMLEVNASHVGLVYNPEVYRAIGRFLARESVETGLDQRATPSAASLVSST